MCTNALTKRRWLVRWTFVGAGSTLWAVLWATNHFMLQERWDPGISLHSGHRKLELKQASAGSTTAGPAAELMKLKDPRLSRMPSSGRGPYAKDYEKALESGLALELMANPFGSDGSLPELAKSLLSAADSDSKEGSSHVRHSKGTPASCTMETDMDYFGEDFKRLFHLTPDACCRACQRQNKRKAGTCDVAVLSAEDDNPPKVCWLKRNISSAADKAGVQAFWPSEQQKFVMKST
mmetsp:Transcript_36415/g.66709  ORF Transcript_36415/g.66709 Transcript_36415/m.66709 type:complete len:236 (+) Transcript_36415:87-794(+)